MKSFNVVGRAAVAAAVLALAAAPAARADGTAPAGGSVGAQLYKNSANNIFVTYVGKQAAYTNDLYYYLTFGGANQYLLRNDAAALGTEVNVTSSAGLAVGSEAIFSICANLGAAAPGTGCTTANQYYTGPASRNPDSQFHATVWERSVYLTQCVLVNACSAASVAAINALAPEYNLIVGFEDSYNYGIDHDMNDVVFAVRGVSTVPEPVTMSLLATGLVGMGGAGAFKRRKKA